MQSNIKWKDKKVSNGTPEPLAESTQQQKLELDRYIGNTHHRGRLWDNRNHRQTMTIGDESVPMFHDDVTHWINQAGGSIGHPCRTIQGSARYLFSLMTVQALRELSIWPGQQPMQDCSSFEGVSLFDQALFLLPCWTNNHCLRPGLNVVII